MTDWAGFRATLLAAVTDLVTVSPTTSVSIEWEEGERSMAKRHILLDISSSVEIGTRKRFVDQGAGLPEEAWSIIRDITVQFKGESEDDTSNADALGTLEEVRLGMLPAAFDAALGLDITTEFDLLPTLTPLRYTSNGRVISVYVFDATFRACFDYAPGGTTDVIETVNPTFAIADP